MPPKKKKKKINTLKKKPKVKVEAKDNRIEEVYEEVVYYNCPVRGRVSQKVKIKRYKSLMDQMRPKHILDSKDPLDRIDSQDDGLSIYNDNDDTEASGDKE